jgi:hypothetical protein
MAMCVCIKLYASRGCDRYLWVGKTTAEHELRRRMGRRLRWRWWCFCAARAVGRNSRRGGGKGAPVGDSVRARRIDRSSPRENEHFIAIGDHFINSYYRFRFILPPSPTHEYHRCTATTTTRAHSVTIKHQHYRRFFFLFIFSNVSAR